MAVRGRQAAAALNAVLSTLLLTAAIGLGIDLAGRHAVRLDLTEEGRATLSVDTTAVLELVEAAQAEVSVTAFSSRPRHPEAAVRDRTLADFLEELDEASPWVSARLVDFDRERATAVRYGVDRYGAVVVEGRGRRVELTEREMFRTRTPEQPVAFLGEAAVGAAIRRVLRERDHTVGVLEGHGERTVAARGHGELRALASILDDQGIEVERLRLLADGAPAVPETVDAVLVLGPSAPISEPERTALRAFVEGGGGLGWFAEPRGEGAGLPELGFVVGRGAVHDEVSYYPHEDRPLLSHGPHPITRALVEAGLQTVVAGAAPVEAPAGEVLLRTSAQGWVQEGEERPVDGAVVAVASALEPGSGRAVVVGDVDVLGDELLQTGPGNRTFVANVVRWLVGADEALDRAGRPALHRPVAMGRGQWAIVRGIVLGWPVVVMLVGVCVLVSRRRRS